MQEVRQVDASEASVTCVAKHEKLLEIPDQAGMDLDCRAVAVYARRLALPALALAALAQTIPTGGKYA